MPIDSSRPGAADTGEATWKVPDSLEPTRLDRMIAALGEMSRGRARRLIDLGAVYVGGKRTLRVSMVVGPGTRIDAVLYAEEVAARAIDRIAKKPPRFVHRERTFALLEKPPGVPVLPTRATIRGTLDSWLKEQPGVEYTAFHHRLDAAARGLIVAVLHKSANRSISAAFQERTAVRKYRALVEGRLEGEGVWEHAQVQRSGVRRAVRWRGQGLHMRSLWRSSVVGADRSLIEVKLETGRTHQIRLQAAAVGHPVVGDLLYGDRDRGGLHLQAAMLALPHPHRRSRVEWALEPPERWMASVDGGPKVS